MFAIPEPLLFAEVLSPLPYSWLCYVFSQFHLFFQANLSLLPSVKNLSPIKFWPTNHDCQLLIILQINLYSATLAHSVLQVKPSQITRSYLHSAVSGIVDILPTCKCFYSGPGPHVPGPMPQVLSAMPRYLPEQGTCQRWTKCKHWLQPPAKTYF